MRFSQKLEGIWLAKAWWQLLCGRQKIKMSPEWFYAAR
jgi:hypothetical protein